MAKNIVLFIDGTWNKAYEEEVGKNSNVYKLYQITRDDSCVPNNDGKKQLAFHVEGIGTKMGRKSFEGITGFGSVGKMLDAYMFLASKYHTLDSVYLFGFSRGAYAARLLAGFVDCVGVLYRSSRAEVESVFRLYLKDPKAVQRSIRATHKRLKLQDLELPPISVEGGNMPIHFLGIWDTVMALGFQRTTYQSNEVMAKHQIAQLPRFIRNCRHALALHDLRRSFEPLPILAKTDTAQTLLQTWFAGAQSDIGGGYDDAIDNIQRSDACLAWMFHEAVAFGLKYTDSPVLLDAAKLSAARVHNSNVNWFFFAKPAVRELVKDWMLLDHDLTDTLRIHGSVVMRLAANSDMKYAFTLPWINTTLRNIDLTSMQMFQRLNFNSNSVMDGVSLNDVLESESVVANFVTGVTDLTAGQETNFLRALCVQLVCGDLTTLKYLQSTIEKENPPWDEAAPPDYNTFCRRLFRVEAIMKQLPACIAILKSEWGVPLLGLKESLAQLSTALSKTKFEKGTALQYPIKSIPFPKLPPKTPE